MGAAPTVSKTRRAAGYSHFVPGPVSASENVSPNASATCLLLALAACAPATVTTSADSQYLHPALAAAPEVRPVSDPFKAARRPAHGGTEKRKEVAGATAVTPSSPPSMVPAAATLPAADSDPMRAEVVESARRVLGISRSFDDRSFLGHILRVNALLPAGALPATYSPAAYLRLARAGHRVVPAASCRPGDIVFFECASGCGAATDGGVAAGVVESVDEGRLTVIAYVDSTVQRCVANGEPRDGAKERRLEKVVDVASVGNPAAAPTPSPK